MTPGERTSAVIKIGEEVKNSKCESSVMLAELAQATEEGLLSANALTALTAAVSCAQTAATGISVKQHVTRSTASISERLYMLLCARGKAGTGINQYQFLTDIFTVGKQDPESIERTLLLEYCTFDREHPTADELTSARSKLGAILRKMKQGTDVQVEKGKSARDTVITVLAVEKDHRAGGGTKQSSKSKVDHRAGGGTKSSAKSQRVRVDKRKQSPPPKGSNPPLDGIRSVSTASDGDADSDDDSRGGGNQKVQQKRQKAGAVHNRTFWPLMMLSRCWPVTTTGLHGSPV
jgi:hypothetical protein